MLGWRSLFLAAAAAGVGCSGAATAPVLPPAESAAQRGQAVIVDPPAASAVAASPAEPRGAPGWLGVALSAPPPDRPGVLISSVLRRSPADVAGLEVGDLVVAIDDRRVNDPAELSYQVAMLGAGRRVGLMVQRQGVDRLLGVELGENPGFEGQLRLGFIDAGAPEFQQVEVAQGALPPTLEGLRGRVVVLEFWATWCGACRALLPTLNDWHQRFEAQGGLVVSVTTDPVSKASRDAAELGLEYPVLSDPDGSTAQAYQAFALPTVFVIDRAGVVRDVSVGYDPRRIAELEATVARLLSET
jgi:peroxiredoxin